MSAYSDYVLNKSPLGYWRLGESSGYPQDSSGNGYHMTIGDATYSQTGAIYGDSNTCMYFNGTNAHYWSRGSTDDNAFDFGPTTNFTIVLWCKFTSALGITETLFSKRDTTSDPYPFWIRQTSSGQVGMWRWDGTTNPGISTSAINDGYWHMLAFGHTDNDYIFYSLDGQAKTTATDSTTNSTANSKTIIIGRGSATSWFYNGYLDEISVFTTALADSELSQLYALGKGMMASRFMHHSMQRR